jgi:hypothetical protein
MSARIGIVQSFTLLEFTVHLGVYGNLSQATFQVQGTVYTRQLGT